MKDELLMFWSWVTSKSGRGFLVYLVMRVGITVAVAIVLHKPADMVVLLSMVFDIGSGWLQSKMAHHRYWSVSWNEGALRQVERAFKLIPPQRQYMAQQLIALPEVPPDAPMAKQYAKVKEAHELISTHMMLFTHMRKTEQRLNEIMAELAYDAGYEVQGQMKRDDLKQ